MLDIRVEIQGDKVLLHDLEQFAGALPGAVGRGLARIAKGAHRSAYEFLSGPGRAPMRLTHRRGRKTQFRGQADSPGGRPGSYPVPVVVGHLRRMLDWLKPGASKTSEGQTFTAGSLEAVVFDSAEYSTAIHEGKGSSAKYGPRPFLADGFRRFDQGNRAAGILEEEIGTEVKRRGL